LSQTNYNRKYVWHMIPKKSPFLRL